MQKHLDSRLFLEALQVSWGPRIAVATSPDHCFSDLKVCKNHLEILLKMQTLILVGLGWA